MILHTINYSEKRNSVVVEIHPYQLNIITKFQAQEISPLPFLCLWQFGFYINPNNDRKFLSECVVSDNYNDAAAKFSEIRTKKGSPITPYMVNQCYPLIALRRVDVVRDVYLSSHPRDSFFSLLNKSK